jgi:holo-[acyl-carrier protein] synthase
MILGIGTDIVKISRLEQLIEKYGTRFLDRTYTPTEIAYCTQFSDPFPRYAVRFAAKEAYSKALGTGIGEHAAFHEIEVCRNDMRRPHLQLLGTTLSAFYQIYPDTQRHQLQLHLSMSHDHEYGTATVIIEKEAHEA